MKKRKSLNNESGATMVEYASIVALILLTAIPAITYTGIEVANLTCDSAVKVREANGQDEYFGRYKISALNCEICETDPMTGPICLEVN